jgi:hypothetical protein
MEDLKQRKLLREILDEVFLNLVEYQEELNKEIADRVFNEIEDIEGCYDICTTLIKKKQIPLVDDFLFPILKSDEQEAVYDKEEVLDKINEKREVIISKVFLKLDYLEIKEVEKSNRMFSGTIVTSEASYPVTIALRRNQEYIEEEKKLYELFLQNSVPWRTINNPYIRKIFDVVIVDYKNLSDEISDLEEINFDLEELEEVKYVDYIPVWNIERMQQKGEGFPLPAEDKIHYDHIISLAKLGLENGCVVNPGKFNVMSVKKTKEKLIITSDESDSTPWEVLKIIQSKKHRHTEIDLEFDFEVVSNSKKDTFINKTGPQKFNIIKTFGELNRLVNSFEDLNDLKLEEVKILDKGSNLESTYDVNNFIEDEIRINTSKQIMELKFTSTMTDYLKYDLLSFIISEVQMYFPEYICKGVFI